MYSEIFAGKATVSRSYSSFIRPFYEDITCADVTERLICRDSMITGEGLEGLVKKQQGLSQSYCPDCRERNPQNVSADLSAEIKSGDLRNMKHS
jgi:hypothetical protein